MTVRMAPLIMAMGMAAFSGCGKADQPSPSESVKSAGPSVGKPHPSMQGSGQPAQPCSLRRGSAEE